MLGYPAAPVANDMADRGSLFASDNSSDDKETRRRKVMDEDDVLAIIGRELAGAIGQDGDELSRERAQALDYYNGKPLGTERDGHSRVVMRNVLEAVEWVLPALLRIFVASDKIATIEPTKPGEAEEEASEAATDYVTQIFYRDNDGFSILHDLFKDALLQKVGWVKRWWNTKIVQETESYTGLTPEEYQAKYAQLAAKGEIERIEHRNYTDPLTGQPLEDCTLQVTMEQSRVCIENVPPEEILFSPRCKRGYMPFVCHRRARTFSDLMEDGYDEDVIRECLGNGNTQQNDEALRRQIPIVQTLFDDPADEAMRYVWVEESYLLMDYNRDGIAELCKVVSANQASRVLLRRDGEPDVEPIDEIPLVWITPVPMPHTLAGSHSLADMVMDLQLIKSTLCRQMLENIYLTNNPRIIVSDNASNENTQADILQSQPGGIIRARDAAGIVPHITPFVAREAFPLLEYLDTTQEIRTGVSRQNQGISPDQLNKYATATGAAIMQSAAAQRVELMARVFARGIQELVRGILGLVRRHQQQARIIMVTGKPLTMDPKLWREELDVSVNVGLGTGDRGAILQQLMQVLQLQQGIVQTQGGVTGPIVYAKNVYDALESLTENAGFKESFFADPSAPPPPGTPPPQPKPDPTMAVAQAQMQIDAQKAQQQAQLNQQKAGQQAQLADRKLQQQVVLDQSESRQEMGIKQAELQARMVLEKQQADNQFQLEQMKLQHELIIARERETARAALAEREFEARMQQQAAQPAQRFPGP